MAAETSSDYIHACNSGVTALDREDVLVIGNWSDYTGSGTANKQEVMLASSVNELTGTDAALLKAKFTGVTEHGKTKQLHRQRQHEQYIEIKK